MIPLIRIRSAPHGKGKGGHGGHWKTQRWYSHYGCDEQHEDATGNNLSAQYQEEGGGGNDDLVRMIILRGTTTCTTTMHRLSSSSSGDL